MEQLLLAVRLVRVFFRTDSHGDYGLRAHPHQLLDQAVLYGGESRESIKYHHTALKDLRLRQQSAQHIQCLLRGNKMILNIILKSPVQGL